MEDRFDRRGHARGLIIELHEVADVVPLDERGMDPLDPGTAFRRVDGTGAAEQKDRYAVDPGVVDRHARVLEANDIMEDRGHRSAGGLVVAVGERDRDLLMGAEDRPRGAVAPVIDERIVEPAEGCARVEGRVLDPQLVEEIDDEVRAEPRRGSLADRQGFS